MAGLMEKIEYTSDNGTTYTCRQDLSNATAAGNSASTANVDLPRRTKPRHILAAHPTTGRERAIVIGDPTNAMWVGTVNSISLPDFAAAMAATAFVIRGRIGERRLA
jgi:hypothetical protein